MGIVKCANDALSVIYFDCTLITFEGDLWFFHHFFLDKAEVSFFWDPRIALLALTLQMKMYFFNLAWYWYCLIMIDFLFHLNDTSQGNLTLSKVIIENVIKIQMSCNAYSMASLLILQHKAIRPETFRTAGLLYIPNKCLLWTDSFSESYIQYSDSWVNDFYELVAFSESNTYSTTNIVQFPNEWLS